MNITIDTSALIAVVGNEESKAKLVELTVGYSLCAPPSVHWEVGNAFSAMFKRGSATIESARAAIAAYQEIPIRFIEVSLEKALELSSRLNIYAYDAYLVQCSLQTSTALLTLDRGLMLAASKAGVECMEIA
ncbi:MAG: type II toxin-antitoxin system VapC family toxin [Candidatus Thiodiazotropha sp. (ex Dulcina madagascariensis)]|nr:type II toxin-antitoxin system VapC family toxin [Candidatus Thiodiazotropha sp. (ex Dulcina madagascariensis)]MCU7937628.1 type II toxin-antitoxin system VapC family toxin [Candidatus Thiodiazotropha sp. (ex Dulcina madagascariensis)]